MASESCLLRSANSSSNARMHRIKPVISKVSSKVYMAMYFGSMKSQQSAVSPKTRQGIHG